MVGCARLVCRTTPDNHPGAKAGVKEHQATGEWVEFLAVPAISRKVRQRIFRARDWTDHAAISRGKGMTCPVTVVLKFAPVVRG